MATEDAERARTRGQIYEAIFYLGLYQALTIVKKTLERGEGEGPSRSEMVEFVQDSGVWLAVGGGDLRFEGRVTSGGA